MLSKGGFKTEEPFMGDEKLGVKGYVANFF